MSKSNTLFNTRTTKKAVFFVRLLKKVRTE